MVTQTNWEDEVIWNGEEIKHKGKAFLVIHSEVISRFYVKSILWILEVQQLLFLLF